MDPKTMQSKGGSARSEAKAVAAINNGHLGGRPGEHRRHRRAHGHRVGSAVVIDFCSCGAERQTIRGERGPWTPHKHQCMDCGQEFPTTQPQGALHCNHFCGCGHRGPGYDLGQ